MTIEDAIRLAQNRARQLRVDPQITVSEVYQAELLRRLQRKLRGELAWKGGIILRLDGSERFSRDLDATRRSPSLSPSRLAKVLKAVGADLAYLTGVEVSLKRPSVSALYQFAVLGLPQKVRIRVEVSTREKTLCPTTTITTARIAHPYGLEPVVVARLDAAELLAEKVRALVIRRASRDIYDVYWLLQAGVEFDLALFLKKMNYYRQIGKPVDPLRALEKAATWLESRDPGRARAELANLLPAAQRKLEFGVIVEDVARAARSWSRRLSPTRAQKPRVGGRQR